MPLELPTLPTGMTAADLDFDQLIDVLVTDDAYFAMGEYTEAELQDKFTDPIEAQAEIDTYFASLGELAEKPVIAESQAEMANTRKYSLPGKRTNPIELTINGMSKAQKAYLESSAFSGPKITIVCLSKDGCRITVFNGLRWVVDWSAETDGLFQVKIATQFSGNTKNRIHMYQKY